MHYWRSLVSHKTHEAKANLDSDRRSNVALLTRNFFLDEKTLIIQAYEYRGESCRTTYFKKAEEFFTFERIPEEELHQQFLVDDIELYRVRRKPATKA